MSAAADVLKKLPAAFNASEASGMDCTLQFNCSTPMNAVIKDGACTLNEGTAANADVAITMEDEDLVALMKRSEEHTSELQSLMRISYADFCLKQQTLKHRTR